MALAVSCFKNLLFPGTEACPLALQLTPACSRGPAEDVPVQMTKPYGRRGRTGDDVAVRGPAPRRAGLKCGSCTELSDVVPSDACHRGAYGSFSNQSLRFYDIWNSEC